MAGVMACSNEDGNEATVVVNNLAGTDPQWVCGYCLGMLGLATLVQLGAVDEAAAKALMETGQPVDAAPADAAPAPAGKRTRKKAAGKVTGTTGETTAETAHACDGGMDGCLGVGVHPVHDDEGHEGWLCHVCYGALGAAAPGLDGD